MPTALITGANRGLGLALCGQYIDHGWQVISLSRSSSAELDRLAQTGALEAHNADLIDDSALDDFADEMRDRSIDVLINNAGTMGRKSFAEAGLDAQKFGTFDRDEWLSVFNINVCTPMHLAELFAEQIAASDCGRVVTVTSMLGSMGLNTIGSIYGYRASKAAVNAIMKSMAIDLASRGIIAIALHPGFVQTDMGGVGAEISPTESAGGMFSVIDGLTPADSGKVFAWNGDHLPW